MMGEERPAHDRMTKTLAHEGGLGTAHSAAKIEESAIDPRTFEARGERVILDADLARLYGVSVSAFNQAVRRNRARFPADFMFQLTAEEWMALRSRFVILKGRPR